MAKPNPLSKLNLHGLSKSANAMDMAKVLGGPQPDLGPLTLLPGTWEGPGFNVVELPNRNLLNPAAPAGEKFRLVVNATRETLTFTPIGGAIPNRGNAQPDISFLGLHYLQQVDDTVTKSGIHLETGLWLNIPSTTAPPDKPTIARLGSVPHGDSFLAQSSTIFTLDGPPVIDVTDTTPFTLNPDGSRKNDSSKEYLAQFDNTPLPSGIPAGSIKDPNLVLKAAIKGQKIIKTVVFQVDANPIAGINGTPLSPPNDPFLVGGIINIPFVNVNANANAFSAIFWIETVQKSDGSIFLQLQYTQTVILDFPVIGPDGKTPVPIKWPHISVATMVLTSP